MYAALSRLAVVLCAVLFLTAAADETSALREKMTRALGGASIREIRKLPEIDLYEVVWSGSNVLYTNASGTLVLVGNLYRTEDKRNLTEARKEELLQVDFSALPLELAFKKVKGDGRRKLVVFADPDCPYCKQLERELEPVTNVTIYVFLFPLTAIHPDAERKARLIWCAPDRAKAWDELMSGGAEPAAAPAACTTPIKEVNVLAEKIGIHATPGIVFESGKLVPGLIPRERIETLLAPAGKS
jgi:thiol:disulfide interchange protein DsbC